MEDYGFEYSDEEPEEQDVDIENQYYNSKGTIMFLTLTIFLLFYHFDYLFLEFYYILTCPIFA